MTRHVVVPTAEDVATEITADWGVVLPAWHLATERRGRVLTIIGTSAELRRGLSDVLTGRHPSWVLAGLRHRRDVGHVTGVDSTRHDRTWLFEAVGADSLFDALAVHPRVRGLLDAPDPAVFADAFQRGMIELSTWPDQLSGCAAWASLVRLSGDQSRTRWCLSLECADTSATMFEATLSSSAVGRSAGDAWRASRRFEYCPTDGERIEQASLLVRGDGPLTNIGFEDVERVEIDDASWIDLDGLRALPKLKALDIGGRGQWWSAEGLERVRSISAPSPPVAGLATVAALPALRKLSLGDCPAEELHAIRGHPLIELSIGRTDDVASLLDAVARLDDLEVLELRMTGVIDLETLAALPRLRTLILPTGAIGSVDLAPLARLATLRRLEIPHHHVDSLEPLGGLRLSTLVIDARNVRLDPLTRLPDLRVLSLRRAVPPPEVARALSSVKELRLLDLEGEDPEVAIQMPNLERVLLSGDYAPVRWPAHIEVDEWSSAEDSTP